MNNTNDQLAAIQAIRNADERQLAELVATLATCAGGTLTTPPAAAGPAARRIAGRGQRKADTAAAPTPDLPARDAGPAAK